MKRFAVFAALAGLLLAGCDFETSQFSFVSNTSTPTRVDIVLDHEIEQTEPDAELQARPLFAAMEYRMVLPGFAPPPTNADPVLPSCFGPLDNVSPASAFSVTQRQLTLSSGPSSLLLREQVRITSISRDCVAPFIGSDFEVCTFSCPGGSLVDLYFRAIVDDCSPYFGPQVDVATCGGFIDRTDWIPTGSVVIAPV